MSRELVGREVHEQLIQAARVMRAHPTPSEALLWEHLRKRRLGGFKFRRQHIIHTLIVDFYCPAVRLVVEVDGGIHRSQHGYDQERALVLDSLGYRLLRVDNEAVEKNIGGVLEEIYKACTQPHP